MEQVTVYEQLTITDWLEMKANLKKDSSKRSSLKKADLKEASLRRLLPRRVNLKQHLRI